MREKVKNITKGRGITLVELRETALLTGNGAVFFILYIKYTGPEATGYTYLTCFIFTAGAT